MLPFIARLLVSLLLLILGLNFGLILVSQRIPATDDKAALPGFDVCQLPCWAGILPGETTFDVTESYLNMNLSNARTWASDSPSVLSFGMTFDDNVVSGAIYYLREKANRITLNIIVPFHYLLEQLGEPTCISLSQPADAPAHIVLQWQADNLFVRSVLVANDRGHFSVNAMAQNLEIGEDSDVCNGNRMRWLGFAPVWRYIRDNE